MEEIISQQKMAYIISFAIMATNIIIILVITKFVKKKFTYAQQAQQQQGFNMFNLQNLQYLFKNNPNLLEKFISEKSSNKDAIITEFQKFKKFKDIKEINQFETDITVIHEDGSEHKYRLHTEENDNEKKIISLTRYS
jgi:hypothetical protein